VNVLIIGASGYIGEPLALQLRKNGHTVYGVVRNKDKAKELIKGEVHVVVGDGTKADTLVEAVKKADVIVNSTMDFTNADLDALSEVAISQAVDKAGGHKKRFIFISGFGVNESSNTPIIEESPTRSEESLKALGSAIPIFETLLRGRIATEKRILGAKNYSGTVVRPPVIYGGAKGHWTLHYKNADEGKVVVYGDPNYVISFLHVDDLVDGLIKIITADLSKVEGQVFTFAEPTRTTQAEIAHAWAKGSGKEGLKEETAPIPIPGFGNQKGHLFVDISKVTNVLGWTPHHNITRDAQLLYDSWKAYGSPEAKW